MTLTNYDVNYRLGARGRRKNGIAQDWWLRREKNGGFEVLGSVHEKGRRSIESAIVHGDAEKCHRETTHGGSHS